MTLTTKIIELLEKSQYIVRVDTMKDGCIVHFPAVSIKSPQKPIIAKEYKFKKNAIHLAETIDGGVNSFIISCNRYAMRAIVWADILHICRSIGYNQSLITIYSKENQKSIGDGSMLTLLPAATGIDREKERHFCLILKQGIALNFDHLMESLADSADMGDDYRIVADLLKI